MKRILTAFFLLAILQPALAQKGLPGYGKIDKADLEMKDCDFDKGADAYTLIDFGSLHYDRGISGIILFKTVYEYRIRIKILKEKGLSYANVTIPFYSFNNEERVLKIDACTINLDDAGNIKTTDVGKSSIYTKKISKGTSEMIIAFPEVKVGSVIEYRYTMEKDDWSRVAGWNFQSRIPVRYSEYQVKIPTIFRFTEQPSVVDSIETKESVFEDVISINDAPVNIQTLQKNYIMHKLAGIKDEPFMGSEKDYQQRLDFQLSQLDYGNGETKDLRISWTDVVKDLNKYDEFGKQLEKKITQTEGLIYEVKGMADPDTKLKAVYNYVRRNMSWNGYSDIYSYDGIDEALEKKSGNSADINLLLINLLNQAGIKALPILFSTRDNGLVNTYYPSLGQFNTVLAYIPTGEKYYILDGTDKLSSYKLVPAEVVNTNGFLVEGTNGKWVTVLENKNKFKLMAALHGEIDADGNMKGDCLVNASGYAKKERCKRWILDKEKFRQEYFIKNNSTIKMEDLTVNNAEVDSLPLEQKVKFNARLNNSGDYRYFKVNMFSGLENNPFIADERRSDIDFGFLQEYSIFGNYTIPDGYKFEELPESISILMPDNSIVFNRFIKAEDNILSIRITVEFKRSFYAAADYPEFKEFYKKMTAKLNEQIVIKKK